MKQFRWFKYIIAVLAVSVYLCGCTSKDEKSVATEKQQEIVVVHLEDNTAKADTVAGGIPLDIQINKEEVQNPEETGEEKPVLPGDEEAEDESEEEKAENVDAESVQEDTESAQEEETADVLAEAVAESYAPGSQTAVTLNPGWIYADHSAINSGAATLYKASGNSKNYVIAVNAGHGTKGGQSVKTLCHPDGSPKVTGGSTAEGSTKAAAVSGGMTFHDGTSEAAVALREAQILRDKLLANGYDVLMLRDGADVQLDNIARTIIANNMANCMISLHWDGDNLDYDKGCFYISTPDALKGMEPVASNWAKHEQLGKALIEGLRSSGCKINGKGSMAIDLTQTSYSTIPSVDIELGNAASAHDDATLGNLADGLLSGIGLFCN